MTALLLDPHGDDAALFAAYTCINHKPQVVITHLKVPSEEVLGGLRSLGVEWHLAEPAKPHVVFAPAYHPEGHEHHNEIALYADAKYGDMVGGVIHYCTYAPRGQRQKSEYEVGWKPEYIAKKLRALSCFVSQIEQKSTRPWFTSLLDLREWYA